MSHVMAKYRTGPSVNLVTFKAKLLYNIVLTAHITSSPAEIQAAIPWTWLKQDVGVFMVSVKEAKLPARRCIITYGFYVAPTVV